MRGIPVKLWDIFSLAVVEASEITLESRLRLARLLWFVGSVFGSKVEFTLIDKLRDRLHMLQRDGSFRVKLKNKIEEVMREENKQKSGKMICDPEAPGDHLDNCFHAVNSVMQFITIFVVSLVKQ
jgi:hypothetical protein